MAIFHCSVKIIGRGQGRSAVGASAYRSGEKIRNEHDGVTHDYSKRRSAVGSSAYRSGDKLQHGNQRYDFTRKQEIVHSEIMLPDHAPREYFDRSKLWNSVEKYEKAKNARTAREVVVALPNELNQEQNIELLRDYVQRNFVDNGMCADVNYHAGHIHERKNEEYPFKDLTIRQENPHAHIMLTVRPINQDGSWGAKSKKEYILDRNGEKIKLPSGNWKSRKVDVTDWDKTSTLEKWREDWARTVNKNFERLGIDERISHLSLKEQGIEREPTIHMGHKAWNSEKKGKRTERGDKNREIYSRNRAKEPERIAERIHKIKENHYNIERKITELKQLSSETQREMRVSRFTAEEIAERAENIHDIKNQLEELRYSRRSMGIFSDKKHIDRQIEQLEYSHEQATQYFSRKYKIDPEQAQSEISRLEKVAEGKSRLHTEIQDKLKPLVIERDKSILEYQRQKLLVEIRPDREQIHGYLSVLEKESRVYKNLVRDDILRSRCDRVLDNITEQNFEEIVKDFMPDKVQKLIELRERERVRDYARIRGR